MIPTITVNGTFRDAAGDPMTGTLSFRLNAPLVDSVGNVVSERVEIVSTLNASGQITDTNGTSVGLVLYCTSGGDIAPAGLLYDVAVNVGSRPHRVHVAIPSTLGSSVDFADLIPVPASTGVVWTAPTTGGLVDSVNTQTGDVVLDATDVGADPAGTAASAVAAEATARAAADTADAAAWAAAIAGLSGAYLPLAALDDTAYDATTWNGDTTHAPTKNAVRDKLAALVKGDVGLGNVDNTSDANKPVSTAQQTALDLKANAANPVFTGTVTIPDGALAIADTSGLQTAIDAKVADAINDGTTTVAPSQNAVFDALALKAPLASPALTGTPTVPTAAQGTSTTQAASTAYVQTEAGLLVPKSLVDAKGDLLVGTADNTVGRLPVGADGTALVADSTQASGLAWKTRSRSISDYHGVDVGPVNTVAETTEATLAVPTTAAVGDLILARFFGDQFNNSGSGATYTYKIKLGATTVFTSNPLSAPTSTARRSWLVEVRLLVVLAASDQRLEATISAGPPWVSSAPLTLGAGIASNSPGYGTATEDLTAGKDIVLTMTLGTAASTIDHILHGATLEVLKR